MEQDNSIFEKVNNWIKNSVMLKLFIITILMLLLLIPASMIKSIISERENLSTQAIEEVSSKWAESQLINGPVLTIPVIYESEQDGKKTESTKYLHILPEELNIDGNIEPEKLKRGIYEVVVYRSNLFISGFFDLQNRIEKSYLNHMQYDKAFLTFGISDLRGIKDQIKVNWDSTDLNVEPGSRISGIINPGISVKLPDLRNALNPRTHFELSLNLRGSQNLSFIPLGNITKVKIESDWTAPKFNGNFLPDNRTISDEGFDATWKILQLNRNLPQTWEADLQAGQFNAAAFGMDLILPVNDYQKSMRSSKYAAMTIALTFLIFFLVEILNKRKIHPFQYTLVGLGLCLFYILLVSMSEYMSFNLAYLISATVIVMMVSLYSLSVFNRKKISVILFVTLSGIYGFLFVTLQLSDYALLMGSIGLTIILSLTMYFTRNINWYKLKIETN